MIITTQKPLDEILDFVSPYNNILIAGCDGCTQPPRGLREAKTLSQLLELGGKLRSKDFVFKVTTTAKQCDSYLTASMLKPQMDDVAAVLSHKARGIEDNIRHTYKGIIGYPLGRHPDEFRRPAGTEEKPYEKGGDDHMDDAHVPGKELLAQHHAVSEVEYHALEKQEAHEQVDEVLCASQLDCPPEHANIKAGREHHEDDCDDVYSDQDVGN